MPAKDIFHKIVKQALEKHGWTITHDPLYLDFGGVEPYIDLGAEKLITA
ncbi:MAG: element excision factor XisH family protein, partial [Snowella sp.]